MKLRMLVVAAVGCFVLPAVARAQADSTNMAAAHDSITRDAGAGPQTAGCPLGCPTSKGAAGLTGVQFLALQQELRDRKCGTNHVTGVLDALTRRAISNCAKRYSVANSAAAVLAAMNVGYTAAELGAAPKG